MARMIFVNLPVADLDRSVAFYKAIGAEQNPQFSDETAAMMVFSDAIHVMLLTHDKFRQFTAKRIADSHETVQVLLALSCDSRDGVDDITERRSPPAAAKPATRRITAGCTAAPSRIPTAIPGSPPGWTSKPPPRRKPRAKPPTPEAWRACGGPNRRRA